MVLKTSTRQTIFLPVVGLVDAESLKPGDLVGVNKVGRGLLLSWARGHPAAGEMHHNLHNFTPVTPVLS